MKKKVMNRVNHDTIMQFKNYAIGVGVIVGVIGYLMQKRRR